jgi:hypothetical protein
MPAGSGQVLDAPQGYADERDFTPNQDCMPNWSHFRVASGRFPRGIAQERGKEYDKVVAAALAAKLGCSLQF